MNLVFLRITFDAFPHHKEGVLNVWGGGGGDLLTLQVKGAAGDLSRHHHSREVERHAAPEGARGPRWAVTLLQVVNKDGAHGEVVNGSHLMKYRPRKSE